MRFSFWGLGGIAVLLFGVFFPRHKNTHMTEKTRRQMDNTRNSVRKNSSIYSVFGEATWVHSSCKEHIFNFPVLLFMLWILFIYWSPLWKQGTDMKGQYSLGAPWRTTDRWRHNFSSFTLTPAQLSSRAGIIGQSGIQENWHCHEQKASTVLPSLKLPIKYYSY